MSSTKDYLEFVLDQLSGLDGITYRAMMGEFIIYYKRKIIGGIYDNRFLVKNTECANTMMPHAKLEIPYEGGTPMILVEEIDDRDFLESLFNIMYRELPEPKEKKHK